eukprot:1103441-Pyramimonas_sp.AAC.1
MASALKIHLFLLVFILRIFPLPLRPPPLLFRPPPHHVPRYPLPHPPSPPLPPHPCPPPSVHPSFFLSFPPPSFPRGPGGNVAH